MDRGRSSCMPAHPTPTRELRDAYRFPGFIPERTVRRVVGDPNARVVALTRRAKKQSAAPAVGVNGPGTIARADWCGIFRVATSASISSSTCGASTAAAAVA